jgi:hypothetical protein
MTNGCDKKFPDQSHEPRISDLFSRGYTQRPVVLWLAEVREDPIYSELTRRRFLRNPPDLRRDSKKSFTAVHNDWITRPTGQSSTRESNITLSKGNSLPFEIIEKLWVMNFWTSICRNNNLIQMSVMKNHDWGFWFDYCLDFSTRWNGALFSQISHRSRDTSLDLRSLILT